MSRRLPATSIAPKAERRSDGGWAWLAAATILGLAALVLSL